MLETTAIEQGRLNQFFFSYKEKEIKIHHFNSKLSPGKFVRKKIVTMENAEISKVASCFSSCV